MKRTLAAAAALVCLTAPAVASIQGDWCFPNEEAFLASMAGTKQVVAHTGVARNADGSPASRLFITVNPETGTWALMYANVGENGQGICVAFEGREWSNVEPEPPGVDS